MAWIGKAGWRVEERTKKTDPAVGNPAVAIPKLKTEGNERVEVSSGDERLGQVRVGEETVPVLHSHVERLNVGEFRRETEVKTGKCEQKVERARGGIPKAHGECGVPVGDGPIEDGGEGRRGTGVGALRKGEDEQASAGERWRVRECRRW